MPLQGNRDSQTCKSAHMLLLQECRTSKQTDCYHIKADSLQKRGKLSTLLTANSMCKTQLTACKSQRQQKQTHT